MPTRPSLIEALQTNLIQRNIGAGFAVLDDHYARNKALAPSEAVPFLFHLAQWVDLGYRPERPLELQLADIPEAARGTLPIVAFLQLKLVDASCFIARRAYQPAIALLDVTLRAGEGLLPAYMLFVANFMKGRAHRQAGSFDQALEHLRAARTIAQGMQAGKLIAVTKVHESWLVFHDGELEDALRLLDEAETELLPTGHALSLGNIAAARGRFIRSTGEYARALEHFERATALYGATYAEHPNNARALVNAAYIKRLMALELQPRMRGEPATSATHESSLQLSEEAMALLEAAAKIYARLQHQGGTGSVLVNRGHLQLECGNLDQAAAEAAAAFELGRAKEDQVLMARARILQVSVELACSEEQLELPPQATPHARLAVQHAEDAIERAMLTQNKRLLAGAYIMRGLAAADDFYREWDLAKEYAGKSALLLGDHDRDHLSRELSGLKLKIRRSAAMNETLRRWSEGDLGSKTFQQVQEEFAEIVIPKVWLNAGRNVTLVARQLSISPKKVRRILRNTKYVEKA